MKKQFDRRALLTGGAALALAPSLKAAKPDFLSDLDLGKISPSVMRDCRRTFAYGLQTIAQRPPDAFLLAMVGNTLQIALGNLNEAGFDKHVARKLGDYLRDNADFVPGLLQLPEAKGIFSRKQERILRRYRVPANWHKPFDKVMADGFKALGKGAALLNQQQGNGMKKAAYNSRMGARILRIDDEEEQNSQTASQMNDQGNLLQVIGGMIGLGTAGIAGMAGIGVMESGALLGIAIGSGGLALAGGIIMVAAYVIKYGGGDGDKIGAAGGSCTTTLDFPWLSSGGGGDDGGGGCDSFYD